MRLSFFWLVPSQGLDYVYINLKILSAILNIENAHINLESYLDKLPSNKLT